VVVQAITEAAVEVAATEEMTTTGNPMELQRTEATEVITSQEVVVMVAEAAATAAMELQRKTHLDKITAVTAEVEVVIVEVVRLTLHMPRTGVEAEAMIVTDSDVFFLI